jgi:serine/threonine protein kinase
LGEPAALREIDSMTKLACPSEDRLLALVNGKLPPETTVELNRHIGECSRCATAVAHLCGNAFAARAAGVDNNRPTIAPKPETPAYATKVDATLPPPAHSESAPSPPLGELSFLSPSLQIDELGRLGSYRILKILGRGGMGLVVQAEDPNLGRLCALKVMLPELARKPEMKERFLREARAAALLEHDNIVPIYQVGEDRGVPFIAMPFLKGASLEDWLEKKGTYQQNGAPGKPIPVPQILKLGREIARGLGAAHERGLVHRDIKPSNIWLDATAGGRVKILDFGLARQRESDRDAKSDKKNLTKTGMIIGTPAYMAPEQAQGKMEEIDGRADLFSLGCILYRMCTGRTPFDGNDAISTLVSVAVDEPDPPSKLNPAIPPALSALVMKLLEKDRNKRPAAAGEVQTTLLTIEKEFRASPSQPADLGLIVVPKDNQAELGAITAAATETTADDRKLRGKSNDRQSPSAENRSFVSRFRWPLIAVGAAVLGFMAIVLAGVILHWETPKGTVRVEINDPDIKVAIDKDDFKIQGADRHEIALRPGEHGLRVKRGDFEFETDKFVLKKGDNVTLKVELTPGMVRVVQDDRVIGEKPLPAAPNPQPGQSSGESEKTPPSKFKPSPDGWIHLLTLVHPSEDAVLGDWEVVGKVLKSHPSDHARLRIPYTPGEEYDLRLTVQRNTGDEAFGVGLVLPQTQVMVFIDGWPKYGHFAGLDLVDGKGCENNETSRKGPLIVNGKPFELVCSVRKDKIMVTFDGRKIIDWSGDFKRLSVEANHAIANRRSLFLMTHKADFQFARMELRPVARPAPATEKRADALPAKYINGLGMSFSFVPKGKAWLGGAAGKPGTTLVELPYDYYLGTYEVTQEEWQSLMGMNPSFFQANWGKDHLKDMPPADFKKFPVERVTRDEALLFIARLNEKDKQAGWVYRLPGPAEWEYACRGGPMKDQSESAFDYYFVKPTNQLNQDAANFGGNEGHTVKVGSYKPNRLGLYDMHGNVSEWCENAGGGRGARGGSWNDTAGNCRASRGGGGRLVRALNTHGIRVARVPVDARPPLIPDDKSDP